MEDSPASGHSRDTLAAVRFRVREARLGQRICSDLEPLMGRMRRRYPVGLGYRAEDPWEKQRWWGKDRDKRSGAV